MNRVRRAATALFMLAALLFSQWVTASFACAMVMPQVAQAAGGMPPGCPDAGTPNTCEKHCVGDHAATDSGKPASLPHVTDFSPLRIELVAAPPARAAWQARRDIPPEPPPAVRFSVLRI